MNGVSIGLSEECTPEKNALGTLAVSKAFGCMNRQRHGHHDWLDGLVARARKGVRKKAAVLDTACWIGIGSRSMTSRPWSAGPGQIVSRSARVRSLQDCYRPMPVCPTATVGFDVGGAGLVRQPWAKAWRSSGQETMCFCFFPQCRMVLTPLNRGHPPATPAMASTLCRALVVRARTLSHHAPRGWSHAERDH